MKWKLVPVDPTLEMVKSGEFAGDVEIYIGDDAAEYTYKAMLAAAPQPPKLSDERIKELSDMYMNMYGFDDVAFARAVEREILGSTQ